MSISEAIAEATTHFLGGKLEEGSFGIFQCPDGILLVRMEDGAVKAEATTGIQAIPLTAKLEITTEPKETK